MTVRTLYTLATAFSLGLAGFVNAQSANEPPATVSNQKLADAVAARINSSGAATGAKNLKLQTMNGVVEISGTVVSGKQMETLVRLAMSVPGVVKVQTSLNLVEIQQASAEAPPISISMLPSTAPQSLDILTPPPQGSFAPQVQQMAGGPAYPMSQEPLPLGNPTQPNYDPTGPKLPPYAWPTYAPYPNMSRVAYPQAYPYNAFPFIGPFYPFPKVPLGWRSVKLEWDDGHWYIGRLSTPHDYWRVRFW